MFLCMNNSLSITLETISASKTQIRPIAARVTAKVQPDHHSYSIEQLIFMGLPVKYHQLIHALKQYKGSWTPKSAQGFDDTIYPLQQKIKDLINQIEDYDGFEYMATPCMSHDKFEEYWKDLLLLKQRWEFEFFPRNNYGREFKEAGRIVRAIAKAKPIGHEDEEDWELGNWGWW